MTPLLQLERIDKSFRGLRAVAEVSFNVQQGAIVALIGPNGAGKTTLFNMIAGALAPDSGAIRFDGARIDGLRPDQICARGIGRTFQIVKPFAGLSVLDNSVRSVSFPRPLSPCRTKSSLKSLARLPLDPGCSFSTKRWRGCGPPNMIA